MQAMMTGDYIATGPMSGGKGPWHNSDVLTLKLTLSTRECLSTSSHGQRQSELIEYSSHLFLFVAYNSIKIPLHFIHIYYQSSLCNNPYASSKHLLYICF